MSSLLELPEDALECICQRLSLEDRVRLLSTCKRLQHVGRSNIWCLKALETLDIQLFARAHIPSLHAWLQARRNIIKRLHLGVTDGQNSATCIFLLGALAGGELASLALSDDIQHFELSNWVLALPRLQHIDIYSRTFTVWRPLAGLTALTSLTLDRPDGMGDALGEPLMDVGSLPTSLLRLELGDVGELGQAVAAATQLQELYIRSPIRCWVQDCRPDMRCLERMVNLRTLLVHGEQITLPPMAPLQRLEVLSLNGPFYCWGSASGSLTVFKGLTNLQRLQFINNPNSHLEEWRLNIRGLQALSLEGNLELYTFPEGLGLSELAVLGIDLDLAVHSLSLFLEMPALRELYLYNKWLFGDADLSNIRRLLPALWEVLSSCPQLEKVEVYIHGDVLKLLTKHPHLATEKNPQFYRAELQADWSQLLPARVQLLVDEWDQLENYQKVPVFCLLKDWREV